MKALAPHPKFATAQLQSRFWLTAAVFLLCALVGHAQTRPQIGYVYPAGGQLGTVPQIVVGGQFLEGVTNAFISGAGVRLEVVEFNKPMPQNVFNQLRDDLKILQDRKQAARRAPDSTNTWTAADDQKVAELRQKILKNPPNRQGTPAIAETVTLRVEFETNAAAGPRELRLGTPNGLSNPLVFEVGGLREYSAPPAQAANPEADRFRERFGTAATNAAAKSDFRVTLPAVVNGQIMPGELDRIRFSARKGQQLVIQARARDLIPYLADAVPGWFQATLALFDAKGVEVAYTDDFRFNPDPVLHYVIPRAGEYTLEIKDSIYRGREDFVYRLSLGELPFVTSIFPLGGPAGVATSVEFTGWNLAPEQRTQTVMFATAGRQSLVVTNGGHLSNLVPFAVDHWPECREQEPNNLSRAAQTVALPVIINGRIQAADDVEVFRFAGRAGQEIIAEVMARRLNSPLDSVLQLFDAQGRQLAFNDDHTDRGAGLETHHADSYLRATLPAEGIYYLHLRDTQQGSGAEYAYRLRLGPPRPDFELRVVPSSLTIRGGATVPLTVFALRQDGFTNEIHLQLTDAPTGFKLCGATIPAGQDKVRFTLTAPPTPAIEPVKLALIGQALLSDQKIERPAVPADDRMQAFIYQHLVPAAELNVLVLSRGMQRGSPRLLTESPVRIPVGGVAHVRFESPRQAPLDKLHLELSEPPEGVSIQKISPSREGVEIELMAQADKAKSGTCGNLIVATYLDRPNAAGGGKNRRPPAGALPAIPFEIVAGP